MLFRIKRFFYKIGLITNNADLITRSSNDGWKNGAGRVVPGESGLAHAGAIVNYECGYVVVTHFAN